MESAVERVTIISLALDTDEAEQLESWLGSRIQLPDVAVDLYRELNRTLDGIASDVAWSGGAE